MLTILTAIIGIFIALLLKRFLLVPDRGKALWIGYLEFPVDANLAAFMFGIGSLSSIAVTEKTPPTLLTMVALLIVSVLLWKYSCSTMSDRDSEVYFSSPKLLAFLTIANMALGIAAIAIPLYALGVSQ